ncbi:MAG: hypothetical protein KFW07_01285, partial [Mycoplasmataceae bacterium]|nr:hypothetical protein [Mycoplasmataceae bacterium]
SSKVVRSTQQSGWDNFKIDKADTLTFTNFIYNNSSFQLYSTSNDGTDGNGHDSHSGINTQILQSGTWESSQLHFDVNFSIQNEPSFFSKLKETILSKLNPDITDISPGEQAIESTLTDALVGVFMDTNFKDEYKIININGENFKNVIYNKYKKVVDENLKEIKSLALILDKIKKRQQNYTSDTKSKSIPSLFGIYNSDNIDYFLTYNQVPIFKTKERIELEPLTDSNYKRTFYSLYLENSIFDTYNWNELNYEKFKNISNLVSEDGNKVSNNALINPEIKNGYFTIPNGVSEYQGMLNDKFGDAPRGYSNNFYYALNSYNKNLKYLNKKYSNKLPSHINNKLINGTNILILRNENTSVVDNSKSILDTYYGEFISLTYDFNESLANKNTLIYDNVTLKSSIEANTRIDPAKVIVIYDLSGNII